MIGEIIKVTRIIETIEMMIVISVFDATLKACDSVSSRNYVEITLP